MMNYGKRGPWFKRKLARLQEYNGHRNFPFQYEVGKKNPVVSLILT